jgi:hypothetical protein
LPVAVFVSLRVARVAAIVAPPIRFSSITNPSAAIARTSLRRDGRGGTIDDPLVLALRFGAALGLGVLLGLERERTKTETSFAGVRTFGLIALAGGVAAFLDFSLARPWFALGVFAVVSGLVIVAYAVTAQRGEFGITTEISALLAFLLGFLEP